MEQELEKDAARYRWLRDMAFLRSPYCEEDFIELAKRMAACCGEQFDKLIDGEMANGQAGQVG